MPTAKASYQGFCISPSCLFCRLWRRSGEGGCKGTLPSGLILSSLVDGPKHGYALIKDIAEFSGTRLEPGTLYGTLARLDRRGWVELGPREEHRRPYRLTAEGLTVLRSQLATMQRIVTTGKQRLAAIT